MQTGQAVGVSIGAIALIAFMGFILHPLFKAGRQGGQRVQIVREEGEQVQMPERHRGPEDDWRSENTASRAGDGV